MRYLEEKDIDHCLALMELVKDDFAGYKEEEFIQAMYSAIVKKEAFIVYDGGEISGLIAFSYKDHEITFLAVNPKFRNMGIAKKLISKVKGCFHPGDILKVVTFRANDPKGKAAVACYHSCGFKDDALVEVYRYPCQKMILWILKAIGAHFHRACAGFSALCRRCCRRTMADDQRDRCTNSLRCESADSNSPQDKKVRCDAWLLITRKNTKSSICLKARRKSWTCRP